MRRAVFLPLLSLALIAASAIGYLAGRQQQARAERLNLRQNTCMAEFYDGHSAGGTYIYVGDDKCRDIIRRTGAKPPGIFETVKS